jgi:signal transduction histidine kinase
MSHTSSHERLDDELLAGTTTLCSLLDGVVLCDRSGIVRFLNPAAARLLEIDADAWIGESFDDLPGKMSLNTIDDSCRVSLDGHRFDERVLHMRVSPIYSARKSDQQIGSVIVYRDVTREERDRNDFLSMLTMDFRSPLSSIHASLDLVLRVLPHPLTKEQREILEIGRHGSRRLMEMLNGLVDLRRLDSHRMPLHLENVALPDVIQEVAQALGEQYAERAIALDVDLPKELPLCHADRGHVHRVISILVDNAYKFTSRGGRIDIYARDAGGSVQVAIRDTGVGIHEHSQRYLFTPFFRAYNSMQEEVGGNGLGLAIAKRLVELQGGRMWFDSAEGQGSTFSFTLPIADAI